MHQINRLRMQTSRGRRILAILIGVCPLPGARAGDDASIYSVSGFGTLGAVYHNRDGVEFRRDISQPNGAKGGQLSFAPDSMLGVQFSARPSSSLEATLQLLSRHSIGTDYQPQVSWAYVKYKPTDETSLRLGRLGTEMYLQGDSAEIGYANLQIRQPIIFYPRTFDGFDAELLQPLGNGKLRLKGAYGLTTGKISNSPAPYDTRGSRGMFVLAEYSHNGWTGRLSTGKLTMNGELTDSSAQALKAALLMVAPNAANILPTLTIKDRVMHHSSLALAYDSGPLQGQASYSTTTSTAWAARHTFSSLLAYRLGNITPYAAYTLQKTKRNIVATGIPWGWSPITDGLNQGSAVAQAGFKTNQSDFSVGIRHATSRNTALKLQVDQIRYQDPESIVDPDLMNGAVETRGYKHLTLFSVALEFVF